MKNNKGFAPLIIALIVAAVLVIGGGAYYLKNSVKKIENTNLAVNNTPQANQNDITKTEVQSNPVVKDTVLPEKDCGISKDTPTLDVGWESSYEGDPALKCFGESALSCANAKVVISGGNTLDKNPALLQVVKNNGVCSFKFTSYQKKYVQCPLSITKKEIDLAKSDFGSSPNLVYKDINLNDPERYSAGIFTSTIMIGFETKEQYQKNGCTGDLYATMSAIINKARENMKK